MTPEEFNTLTKRLFTAFPSLREWLAKAADDPQETLKLWRNALARCRFDDCLGVVSDWSEGRLKPFEAFERDRVHLCIKAIAEQRRSRANRKAKEQSYWQEERRNRKPRPIPSQLADAMSKVMGDSEMAAAFNELQDEYKRLLDGDLTQREYATIKDQVISKHLDRQEAV